MLLKGNGWESNKAIVEELQLEQIMKRKGGVQKHLFAMMATDWKGLGRSFHGWMVGASHGKAFHLKTLDRGVSTEEGFRQREFWREFSVWNQKSVVLAINAFFLCAVHNFAFVIVVKH